MLLILLISAGLDGEMKLTKNIRKPHEKAHPIRLRHRIPTQTYGTSQRQPNTPLQGQQQPPPERRRPHGGLGQLHRLSIIPRILGMEAVDRAFMVTASVTIQIPAARRSRDQQHATQPNDLRPVDSSQD